MDHDILYLNVGGVFFVTRRVTLQRSDSFFSGAVAANPEATELFIDRDPTHFRHILNWLRGCRHLPEDDATLHELQWEADYFSMHDMRDAILRTKSRYSLLRSAHMIYNEMRSSK